MVRRKVYNIEQFIKEQPEDIREIVIGLHELFLGYPNASYKIRYNIPFYDYLKWVCYINPVRKGKAIELVFLNGVEFKHIFPFLEDKGRKMVAGIEIEELSDEVLEKVIIVWQEALQWAQGGSH